MKQALVLIICIMVANISFSQVNENFLADICLNEVIEKSKEYYITEAHGTTDPYLLKNLLYKKFCVEQQLCDSIHIDEMCEYAAQLSKEFTWNANAPIFQSKEYKSVRFVDNKNAIKLIRKNKYVVCISQPAFSSDSEYALAYRSYYTNYGRKHFLSFSSYVVLFKKVSGKWKKLEECIIATSSS